MIDTLQKAALAARFADEKKAEDIIILDLQGLCNFTDTFVICTGNNRVQLAAIREGIIQGFKAAGFKAPRDAAEREAKWLVLDYGDVVIHIMSSEARSFYRLENLWGDAERLDWQKLVSDAPVLPTRREQRAARASANAAVQEA